MPYERLDAELIVQTLQGITHRIQRRFHNAGLVDVARELESVARKAARRADDIRRPYIGLRLITGLTGLAALAMLLQIGSKLELRANLDDAVVLVEFAEAAGGTLLFLGAVGLFLFSLENRWKRRRAMAALHELRVLAHIIDMHQVSKQPERVLLGEVPTTKTLFELNRYLNYCTELLAIISKIASLYVQEFPDALVVTAVDDIEKLSSGLANRIWQKLQVVDQSLQGGDRSTAELAASEKANAEETSAEKVDTTTATTRPIAPATDDGAQERPPTSQA